MSSFDVTVMEREVTKMCVEEAVRAEADCARRSEMNSEQARVEAMPLHDFASTDLTAPFCAVVERVACES